jgi:tRNA U55 pseudouridine synthase TruB
MGLVPHNSGDFCWSTFLLKIISLKTADEYLNQILLIDKPLHFTSFQAVNKLKCFDQVNQKKFKIGHAER